MKLTDRRTTPRAIAHRDSQHIRSRNGTMLVWGVWVLLALLITVGCFLNVMRLSCARAEARRCAESAVIVGGHAFLSDDLLRPRQQPFEHEGRAVRCRAAAVDYIRQAGNPAIIPVITQSDVELTPSSPKACSTNPETIPPGVEVPHEIRISFGKCQSGDQLRMFFRGLTDVRNARLGVTAAARIEHTPVGFQPGGNLTIPVLPLAIVDQSQNDNDSLNSGGLWSEQIESGKGSDNLSWNPHQHSVESGSDGLPEITLILTPNSCGVGPDGLVPLTFAATSGTDGTSQSVTWIKCGVTADDLNSLGISSLSFPSTIPAAGLSRLACAEIASCLQSRTGEAFIVCLCDPATAVTTSGTSSSSQASVSAVKLNRPVAARIMAVGLTAGGDVRIRLQPCVLITSTAMMSDLPEATLNRYIYSVRLSD